MLASSSNSNKGQHRVYLVGLVISLIVISVIGFVSINNDNVDTSISSSTSSPIARQLFAAKGKAAVAVETTTSADTDTDTDTAVATAAATVASASDGDSLITAKPATSSQNKKINRKLTARQRQQALEAVEKQLETQLTQQSTATTSKLTKKQVVKAVREAVKASMGVELTEAEREDDESLVVEELETGLGEAVEVSGVDLSDMSSEYEEEHDSSSDSNSRALPMTAQIINEFIPSTVT